MAGNPYGPLYNSVQARGRMSPIGAPGALMPKDKKPGLGSKAASALGAMMDQAGESNKAMAKEQVALLEGEHGRLGKMLSNGQFKTKQDGPNRGAMGEEVWVWNKDYKGDKTNAPTPDDWNKYFAVKGQLGKRTGVEKYQERKTSVFDYEFPDTAKPKSNSIFGKAFSQIMG